MIGNIQDIEEREADQAFYESTDGDDIQASFASEDIPSFLKPTRDRMHNMSEVHSQRMQKFKDLEHIIDPNRQKLEEDYSRISSQLNQIKIRDNLSVPFDEEDQIFQLSDEIDKSTIQEKVGAEALCNCCGRQNPKKIQNCQFCGTVNCGQCASRIRPYPMNNPTREKRGSICTICFKKFLYRDAMHEFTIKLELKEGVTQTQQEDLEYEEENYKALTSLLRELKEIKIVQQNEIRNQKEGNSSEQVIAQQSIQKLIKEKDQLAKKYQQGQTDNLEKKNRIEDLQDEITRHEKSLKEKSAQLQQVKHEVNLCQQKLEEVKNIFEELKQHRIIKQQQKLQSQANSIHQDHTHQENVVGINQEPRHMSLQSHSSGEDEEEESEDREEEDEEGSEEIQTRNRSTVDVDGAYKFKKSGINSSEYKVKPQKHSIMAHPVEQRMYSVNNIPKKEEVKSRSVYEGKKPGVNSITYDTDKVSSNNGGHSVNNFGNSMQAMARNSITNTIDRIPGGSDYKKKAKVEASSKKKKILKEDNNNACAGCDPGCALF